MYPLIREILTGDELERSVEIIRAAFETETANLDIAEANCPVYPAYLKLDQFKQMIDDGLTPFGLFVDGVQAGVVAIGRSKSGKHTLKKLAVLPQYRHCGYGRMLVDFVLERVREDGGGTLMIALVAENAVLKRWYEACGFRQTETKRYEHLPFAVTFMEMDIQKG